MIEQNQLIFLIYIYIYQAFYHLLHSSATMKMIFPFLVPSMAVLLLSFSFFLPGFSAHPETERLIQDICHRVDNFQFCNATMKANLPADIGDLAKLSISVALDYATNTKGYAEELRRHATDKALKFYLTICSNAYGVVKDSFTAAEKQFGKADFAGAEESEKKAVQPIKDCDFIFTRPPQRSNPLQERNEQMREIIQTAITALQSFLP